MTIAEALRNAPLFSKLDDQEIATISARCALRHFSSEHALLTQHEFAQSVYILKSGAVRLLSNNELIAVVRTVQVFGEMSCILDNTPASATVVTDGECDVIEISKPDFLKLLDEVPRIWMTLFRQTTSRLAKGNLRLSEVLEHSPEGFLKLDRHAKITDEFSSKCELYFGIKSLGGRSFPELVYAKDPKQIQSWLEIYAMLFEDSVLSFEDICYLLTSDAQMGSEDAPRDLLFSYHPSRDLEGNCVGIDVGVKDVTEQRKLERAQALAKEKETILARVHANPESFFALQDYMAQTVEDLKKHVSALQLAAPNAAPATPEELARKLHSLKGFAGMYALDQLHDAVDHMEMELKHFQHASMAKCLKAYEVLEQSASQVADITNGLDPNLKKRLLGIVIAPEEFDSLLKCIQNQDSANAERILSSARSMAARHLFTAWPLTAHRLGDRIEKDVQFSLDGDDAMLPMSTFNELGRVLPQLLRNAVDHGIELPALREQMGKPRMGTIKVQLVKLEHRLAIHIHDDGAGIDFEKIKEVALKDKRLNSERVNQLVDSGQVWRILFMQGFSTKALDTADTSLSGMGVGLDAVNSAVDELGGTVFVSSELAKGAQFTIEIPLAQGISSPDSK